MLKPKEKTVEELAQDHHRRLEALRDVVGRVHRTGNVQRWMETLCCAMCRAPLEGQSTKFKLCI